MSDRLSQATLSALPADIATPAYDRNAVRAGIVHLGIGAFHRAHQAIAFDDCLAADDLRWGVTGVSLRSPDVRDTMVPQDGLYGVVVRDGEDERVRIVGAVRDVLVAPEEPERVVEALASPDTHLVTLTITEKGYKIDAATGDLLTQDPDIAADLNNLAKPRTAAGFLAAALAKRHAAGLPPFTAISCDNLPHNGHLLRSAVIAMARAHDGTLADWIEAEGAFPQTMVDRIVPATDAADLDRLEARTGLRDEAAVKTEPFLQWVIEDRFVGPRPDFTTPGVTIVADVGPWEAAKLRLLNGAHSGIAYLGALGGVDFVHQFVGLPEGRAFVEALWDEAAPTLTPPEGLDIPDYRAALMARFANSALNHRTRQIAMDGSQKVPQRLLATIAARAEAGASYDTLALAVAAWIRWVGGRDDAGNAHRNDDPRADDLSAAYMDAKTASDKVAALLSLILPAQSEIGQDVATRDTIADAYIALSDRGSLAVLRETFGRG